MANFFSLQDGNLTDISVYGYSLSTAEVMSNTTGVWLSTVDAYGPSFTGDGSNISAVAVHLSARAANPTNSILTLILSSASSIRTETYPVSSFTSYNGSNNLLTNYPQNWQILKLSSPYTLGNGSACKLSLATSSSSTLSLIGSASNNNYNKVILKQNTITPTSADNIHIGGGLNGVSVEPRTITATTSTFQNLYIHNQGILTFPLTSSKTLTLVGSVGLQITSDGTLNIGTNSSSIPLSTTHTIILSNTQIDVHNGGNLNVYGYTKQLTTNLISDITSSVRTFSATDSISGSWSVNDSLIFKPNLTTRISFDALTLSSFVGSNVFTTTANSTNAHTGSATYSYVPTIYNLSRNVKINGFNSTNRATIRTVDAAKTNINYLELNNFGISGTNNKNGFLISNNLSGSTTLNGSVINSDNISNIASIVPLTGKTFQNVNIYNNIIKSNSLTLSSLSVNNVNISNNYILSSASIGLQINNLSGSINMSNNTTIGSLSYGSYLYNNTLTGSYGALGYNSGLQGTMVSGTNTGTIVGGGINSFNEGVYANAATSNLSGVTFQNIIASNNSSVGFKVSGNSLTYANPVVLNINGLSADTNSDAGFEGYNITGNISSLLINNTTSNTLNVGVKTSIGNGPTIFDGLTSYASTSFYPTCAYTATNLITTAFSPFGPTENSVYFNGTGYITVPASDTSIYLGSVYTWETWVYLPTIGVVRNLWTKTLASTPGGTEIYINTNNTFAISYNSAGTTVTTTSTVSANRWTHLAITRDVSNNIRMFINGTLVKSQVYSESRDNNSCNLYIGASYLASPNTAFYMSNTRVVTGQALYTSDFTPSSTPLTVIPNTVFLLKYPFNGYKRASLSTQGVALNILSGYNHNSIIIKNSLLSSASLDSSLFIAGTALNMSVDKLEEFRLEGSTLSANTPLKITSTRSKLEGSYMFHNSNSNVYGLSSLALTGYQSEVFKESGLVVMRENGLSANHYKYLAAGSITLDKTVVNAPNTVSERLTPWSATTKLRSTSKMIPVNFASVVYIFVLIKRSAGYTGAAPRLVAVSNPSVGINGGVLYTSVQTSGWELMSATLPATTNSGYIEFYVDCSGNVGSGYINIDSWDFNY